MTDNPSLEAHPNVEDWIVVRADGGVEVRTGKVEIGQGIDTAVALIVADELGVPSGQSLLDFSCSGTDEIEQ
ncbi:MAG: molybdopterin-dependent oxidoreductase, partial [bacterium]|nr:molybdopterin-dependent oxidoreductase [bacterium]